MRRTQAGKVRRSLPDHPRLALCSRAHSSHPIVCHCTFIHALAYDAHAFFTCYACVLQVFLQRSRAQIDAFLNAGMPQEHAAICRYHRYAVSISTKKEAQPMQIQNDLSGSTAIASARTTDTSADTSGTSASTSTSKSTSPASSAHPAQGAAPAASSSGDSITQAAVKQLKALIESLQKKLAALQQQMARAQQQATSDSSGAAAAMVASLGAQATTVSASLQTATAELAQLLLSSSGKSTGGIVDTQA
jgi:hypothetical protein